MRPFLLKYWDQFRSSFWFVPSLMTGAAAGMAFATVALDRAKPDEWMQILSWAYTGGAAGASAVLGTISGSMITIAGVVFSMTLVALSLTTSQLGPRLLRTFMTDRANQMVLGTFVATFVYCLLVLRTIRYPDEGAFVPHLSVTLGVALALVSVGVLIYFIHHISRSIQADVLVGRIGKEVIEEVGDLYPGRLGREADDVPIVPTAFEQEARPIPAAKDGYVQTIDPEGLMDVATEEDLLFRIEQGPGRYVVAGRPLVCAHPGGRVSDRVAARVNGAFVLGIQRTPEQDLEFAANQLVEIAVRALSPSLNDPFTAIRCIDQLGSALCRLAQREMPSPYRHDEDHRLRVIAPGVTFPSVVDAAFDKIRRHAGSSIAVLVRLLEMISVIAASVERPGDRDALREQATMIVRKARTEFPEGRDLNAVEDRYDEARDALQAP
ncbi:MAG: DUF2254 domain-containing protein [Salinibacter sp.]